MAGIGTMIFFVVTGGRVPSYLGSSFAFLGPIFAITNYGGLAKHDNFSCISPAKNSTATSLFALPVCPPFEITSTPQLRRLHSEHQPGSRRHGRHGTRLLWRCAV